MSVRRAIIGEQVRLSNGQIGKVTGIDSATFIARVALDNGAYRDVPQDSLQHLSRCAECNGSGKLTRLGGDWGKTPDTEVACWACNGIGVK